MLTAAGLVAIENIRAGDAVISTNPDTLDTAEKTVLETYVRQVDKLVHLTINGEKIVTTVDHPFYVQNRGFINAGNLLVGDTLISVNGNDLIVSDCIIEKCENPETVYNFQVEDYHTYFVGECEVWVHNAGELYKRGGFRKSTHEKALLEAPRNQNGEMICPTCGKKIQNQITQQTKNGLRNRRGYDLDHYPTTWNERVKKMEAQTVPPTRKEVLNIYNEDVRVQCPDCNQSHKFEGV